MGHWDRILKYIRGGPSAIDGWPDPIPAAELAETVERTLGAALHAIGFETVGPRRWVRSTRAPVRDVIELGALKGSCYAPAWGLSLDFVPHLTAKGEGRWHRTAKQARFDLVHRPLDYAATAEENREWTLGSMATRPELAEDLARVTRLTLAEAPRLWDRVRAPEDLPGIYDEYARRPATGLPFRSYPPQVLAHAFVKARAGLDGRAALAEFVREYDVPAAAARKLEALIRGRRRPGAAVTGAS